MQKMQNNAKKKHPLHDFNYDFLYYAAATWLIDQINA